MTTKAFVENWLALIISNKTVVRRRGIMDFSMNEHMKIFH